MNRLDLSTHLIHLTRGDTPEEEETAFKSIFQQGTLRGSSKNIRGDFNCICFTETPLSALAQVLANSEKVMRYAPFGVAVSREWLFSRGGRPVIYQPNDDYDLLHQSHKYRHVRYEPSRGCDYTWEREWRINTDQLQLSPYETTFIVPTRKWVDDYHMSHVEKQIDHNAGSPILALELPVWHFLVLEDLGVRVTR